MNRQIKLSIKLENKNPIELNQLILSLNAIASQYDSFLRKSKVFDYHKSQRKFYISKIESGSLYAELLPAVVPLLTEFNSIIEFGSYLKDCYDYFLGKKETLDYELTKNDCNELSEIVGISANDNGSKLNLTVNGDNNNVNVNIVDLSSLTSNALENSIRKYSELMDEQLPRKFTKELMYWANASFMKDKVNDKVIIESIDKKPKKVVFENDEDKMIATTHCDKFPGKNWQDLAYIADVTVSYIQDIPKEYKITKLYKEETFDPSD